MRTISPLFVRPRPLWLALTVGLALAACAGRTAAYAAAANAPARQGGRHCFLVSQINNWRAPDQHTVYVRANINRIFRMQLMGPCPNVDWTRRLGIKATPGPEICSGIDATIIAPSPIGPRRCPVTAIHELTPAEIAATPKKDLP
jgi:hypothetical protein